MPIVNTLEDSQDACAVLVLGRRYILRAIIKSEIAAYRGVLECEASEL